MLEQFIGSNVNFDLNLNCICEFSISNSITWYEWNFHIVSEFQSFEINLNIEAGCHFEWNYSEFLWIRNCGDARKRHLLLEKKNVKGARKSGALKRGTCTIARRDVRSQQGIMRLLCYHLAWAVPFGMRNTFHLHISCMLLYHLTEIRFDHHHLAIKWTLCVQ